MRGYEIVRSGDVISGLQKYRINYAEKGVYLGFENVHEFYSMQPGGITDWTGYPMSGKTQVLMEFLLNTSLFYGWRHLIYFPDVGNSVEIVADLIHKKTGKSFNPLAPNHISEIEISHALDWVLHHFRILTRKDMKAKMSPIDFWDYAVKIKKEDGLETASIDSWKDLQHDYSSFGGYAQYLEFVLPYRNQIAEDNEIHLHTIIHPKLTEKEKDGSRKPPVPYDLKGGSEWFNSGKSMVTVHRPFFDDNLVQIFFNKIKPRSIGSIGSCELRFDVNRFRYYNLRVAGANQFINDYAKQK